MYMVLFAALMLSTKRKFPRTASPGQNRFVCGPRSRSTWRCTDVRADGRGLGWSRDQSWCWIPTGAVAFTRAPPRP